MGVIGAIMGDIAGSGAEGFAGGPRLIPDYDMYSDRNRYTGGTVLSIACVEACNTDLNFLRCYRQYYNDYPDAGYNERFCEWAKDYNLASYNSFGSDAAIRCSYIGQHFPKDKVEEMATLSAKCTHDHPEGIKGAVTLAMCVRMAEDGMPKDDILKYGMKMYPKPTKPHTEEDFKDCALVEKKLFKETTVYRYPCEAHTDTYRSYITKNTCCQGSVPVAIRCFYDTDSFMECMYLINSMQIDTDAVGAIAGAICESYYGRSKEEREVLEKYLDKYLYSKLEQYGAL